jgi:hypothetical protein
MNVQLTNKKHIFTPFSDESQKKAAFLLEKGSIHPQINAFCQLLGNAKTKRRICIENAN